MGRRRWWVGGSGEWETGVGARQWWVGGSGG